MNAQSLKAWYGQVTTGIGALIGTPTVIAILTHQITPQQAVPALVASVLGLIWPENTKLAQAGQTLAADAETFIPQLMVAYRTGIEHGAAASKLAQLAPALKSAAAPAAAVAAIVLLLLGLGISPARADILGAIADPSTLWLAVLAVAVQLAAVGTLVLLLMRGSRARSWLRAALIGGCVGLGGCGAGADSGPSPAQTISDLQGSFQALAAQMPALQAADPTLAAKLVPYVTNGTALLANLSASSPNMTTQLSAVEGVVNSILTTAAQSGVVPAPWNLLVEALSVAAPEIETVLGSTTVTASVTAPAVYSHPDVPSITAARSLWAKYR